MVTVTTARSVLRDWWLQEARIGMSPAEMIDSLLAALKDKRYVIVKDRTDPEGGIPGRG